MLESVVLYSFQSKLYIWKKSKTKSLSSNKELDKAILQMQDSSKLSSSKLRDLAWSLDVLDLAKNKENQL